MLIPHKGHVWSEIIWHQTHTHTCGCCGTLWNKQNQVQSALNKKNISLHFCIWFAQTSYINLITRDTIDSFIDFLDTLGPQVTCFLTMTRSNHVPFAAGLGWFNWTGPKSLPVHTVLINMLKWFHEKKHPWITYSFDLKKQKLTYI